jgi:hypothetical protein
MLDCYDDDFLDGDVNAVIDDVGVAPRDNFAHTFHRLRSACAWEARQEFQRLQNGRSHARPLEGFWNEYSLQLLSDLALPEA